MKKTEAIKEAREAVGNLFRFGAGYKYNSFDESTNAWVESNPQNYHSATISRANKLIEAARKKMGKDEIYLPYEGGSWVDYLD